MPVPKLNPDDARDSDDPQALAELIETLRNDRPLAHAYLFEHRHPDLTPDFHREMIAEYYSDHRNIVIEAFRGGAKSTIVEEALCIEALLEEFDNALIIGESETRAKERLHSIKNEIETNERIIAIWGDQVGVPWGDTKIKLCSGAYLQALGREQSVRGVKHHAHRPDRLVVDDYEDEEAVATPEAREKWSNKFHGVVMPALDKRKAKTRVYGTPLDVAALLVSLKKLRAWRSKRYPIKYLDEQNIWRPTWPGRWTIAEIDALEQELRDAGKSAIWEREYMLNAVDEATKPFKRSDFKIQTLVHTWEPTYVIYDPARTTKTQTSAHTGYVVMSWLGNRIVCWESGGHFWKPDEIVRHMFEMNVRYNPVAIGVEIDGLHEFLLQPIRHAQMQRGVILPIRALKAPRATNKDDFIKGLQPFVKAGEFILNGEQEQLLEQFDAFPRGRKDIPNAAAYLPRIRAGVPVYKNFGHVHVAAEIKPVPRVPLFLCINADSGFATAALVQIVDGATHVLGDWLSDRPMGDMLYNVLRDVGMEFAGQNEVLKPRVIAPLHHWADYNNLGLVAAAKQIPVDLYKGGEVTKGREEIRALIDRAAGKPGVQVSQRASWVMRAMAEGYAYDVERAGHIGDEPMENIYRTMMEGIEALMALARTIGTKDDTAPRVAYTADGRRYTSARATPR